jgi:hypothetical protein
LKVLDSNLQLAERQSPAKTCDFEGNSDIYGLGIRLGIYFGWISSCISTHGRFDKQLANGWPTDLVNAAFIFEIAIFIATVVLATNLKSTVHSVELMLMTLIFFGDFYFVQVAAVIANRMFFSMYSLAGLILRVALCLAMLSFSVWLWFPGFDQFQQTPCGSYVFIFAKVSIAVDGVRKFLRALACLHLLIWALPLALVLIFCSPVLLAGFAIILIWPLVKDVIQTDGNHTDDNHADDNHTDGRVGFFATAISFWQLPIEDLVKSRTNNVFDPPDFWVTNSMSTIRR